jgi:signal transduction histidine kinase/CheY-like chemotaxis protein
MSMRVKVFLVIISIVVVITASCMAFSIFFTQTQVLKTIENDMLLAAGLADEVITNRVNLLMANAAEVVEYMHDLPETGLPAALEREVRGFQYFIGMTVLDSAGKALASYEERPIPAEPEGSEYIRRALGGQRTISTTRLGPGGELVFNICMPMAGNRVLVTAVPGLIFSEMLSRFQIWETGSIFVVDGEGVMVASRRTERVLDRTNVIEMGKTSPAWAAMGDFVSQMIRGGQGTGRYAYFGAERICAYMPITEIGADWYLGAAAPIAESPMSQVQYLLGITAALFLGLGFVAAFFASDSIARPFRRIQEQNLRLEELKRTAQDASEAKSQFLANMSHEMRTPLNAVIGLSELSLGGTELSPAVEENLEKIYNSGLTLLGIVNNLLDISKIESGKFEIVPAEYDLPSLINDTINLNIIRIGSKPITFKLLIDETLPSRLCGDELRIKQIFNNLLSNAFKYTIKGSVILRIACQEADGAAWLTISVKDSGFGIRPEDQEKLFDDYNRLDYKKTHTLEGTGLGLALTKNIAELMGGTISVESEYGKGSTFTVRVKQEPVESPPIGAKMAENLMNFRYSVQKRNRNAGLARIKMPYARVLVVDDVPINLDVAKGMLRPYDMQVDCVLSGKEAVELIREHKVHYDAVFMDHMMPEMDGIEATRIIREEIRTDYAKRIPIVVLTANALAGNEEMFMSLGFDDFLSKPIDIMRLDAVVHRWVRDKSREEKAETLPPETGAAGTAAAEPSLSIASWRIEGIDMGKALERFSNIEDSLVGALRSYTVHIHALLDALRIIPLAGQDERIQEYTVAIHSVKGASYGICADEAGRRAEALEQAVRRGNLSFVSSHTGELIAAVEKLAAALAARLREGETPKPKKDAPDPALLGKLKEACALYQVDEVDRIMEELEKYEYESQPDLIPWLRERVNTLDFQKIPERL